MKVGLDARALEGEPAGIGTYVKGLLIGLSEIDSNELEVVAYSRKPLKNLPSPPDYFSRAVINLPSLFWHLGVALHVLRNNVDVYHSTHSLIMPILLGKNVVLTIHDLTPLLFPKWHTLKVRLLTRFCLFLALSRVRYVICDSLSSEEDLKRFFPRMSLRVTVVPLGVSSATTWQPNRITPYLLFVGTLEPRKNLEFLLKVMASVVKSVPDVSLVIAGKEGWGYEGVYRMVADLGLSKTVAFTGYISDDRKWEMLSQATLLVYPSYYEGFGLPVLEAMAVGLPVVVARTSSLPEVAGKTGLSLPIDENVWVHSIISLLNDRKRQEELSRREQEREAGFSWRRTAEGTLKVYKFAYANFTDF